MINELSPKFIWLIRDFTLNKVNPETNEPIEGKEYLEICLRKKVIKKIIIKISGKNSSENNMIRDNIMKYFTDRDCITLVRPIDSEEELRNLNKLPFSKLKPEFKSEFIKLKQKVYEESSPKIFNGKKLNGTTLVYLLNEFINAINNGAVPNINNVYHMI